MKIICAGFWKTGTKSLAQALRMLGYKVYDFDDQYFELAPLWNKFFDGSVTDDDIRQYLKDIDVLIDGPVIAFWEEISRAIPDAKVILSIRDEDSWWRSFKTMQTTTTSSVMTCIFPLFLLAPSARDFVRVAFRVGQMCLGVEGLWRLPFLNFNVNSRLYKLQFRKHNGYVLHTVPKKNLLVYPTGSGWGPLCDFLGLDTPDDTPFPHKNKAGSNFLKEAGPRNAKVVRIIMELVIILSAVVALLGYAIYYFIS